MNDETKARLARALRERCGYIDIERMNSEADWVAVIDDVLAVMAEDSAANDLVEPESTGDPERRG